MFSTLKSALWVIMSLLLLTHTAKTILRNYDWLVFFFINYHEILALTEIRVLIYVLFSLKLTVVYCAL